MSWCNTNRSSTHDQKVFAQSNLFIVYHNGIAWVPAAVTYFLPHRSAFRRADTGNRYRGTPASAIQRGGRANQTTVRPDLGNSINVKFNISFSERPVPCPPDYASIIYSITYSIIDISAAGTLSDMYIGVLSNHNLLWGKPWPDLQTVIESRREFEYHNSVYVTRNTGAHRILIFSTQQPLN